MLKAKALKKLAMAVTALLLILSMAMTSLASTDYEARKKAVSMAGISSPYLNPTDFVTRQDFARMVVMASPYADMLTSVSSTAVYADVPAVSEYASAIKICAQQNWMSGYLGGTFRPAQGVTLNEAEKALLGLLGYTDKDFAGDLTNLRSAKAVSLSLTENVAKNGSDFLTVQDCVNLFYNLMRCSNTQGKSYASVLGGSLSSDGEVNVLGMLDNSLTGPKYLGSTTGYTKMKNWLPFDPTAASYYLDGSNSSLEKVKQAISNEGVVAYYSGKAKAVWAYALNGDIHESGKGAYQGTIDSILYQSSTTLTPSGVVVDGMTFDLTSADMQFAFSIYGSVKVGEDIVIIYNGANAGGTGGGSGNPTVVDFIYE